MTDDPHDEMARIFKRSEDRKEVAARMAQHFEHLERRDYTRPVAWGLIFLYAAAVFGFVGWLIVGEVM